MRYYYEYKEKNGCKVDGHNLEKLLYYFNVILIIISYFIKYNVFKGAYQKRYAPFTVCK